MKKHLANIREKAGRHKTLIQNFSYLSALQVFNMLLPLVTYPYLIRVLGKETYGLVVYAQAIVGYLVILVGFGFNISATKEISIHRDNREKLSEIVSSVLILKSGLFALSAIILVVLLLLIPQAKGYEALFLLMLWLCLYDLIFPMWYFQGIEKMKYITYLTLVSRLIFLCLIFVLIHKPSDYLLIPAINGIGALISGTISLYYIFIKHEIKFSFQPYAILKHHFKDSIPIFVSNVSIKLYLSTNKVIIGSFLGMSEVAYYDLAEKLFSVLKMPVSIFSQVLFPKISKERNIAFINKILNKLLLLNVFLYVLILALSKYLVLLIGGESMKGAVVIVNVLSISLPIIAAGNIFGVQLLLAFGHNRAFSKIIIGSSIFYSVLLLGIYTIAKFTTLNVAIASVLTEVFVTFGMYFYCVKLKLLNSKLSVLKAQLFL